MSDLTIILNYSFELQIFLTIFATLVASFLYTKTLNIISIKVKKTSSIWDDALIYALNKPGKLIILVFGFSFVMQIFSKNYNLNLNEALHSIRVITLIFAATLSILRLLKKSEESFLKRNNLDNEKLTTINAIVKLLKISVIITSTLILMQTLGINISGILAFGGVSGIAIGFAAKDLLSNFFGALMIYLDKPFRIGDWISSPDKEIEGTVEAIGWRQTRIRKFDQRPIYVPNSVFSTITVENPSRMTHRRISETIGVRYDDFKNIGKIINKIEKYITDHSSVDKNKTIIVKFNKYAESSLDIMIYFLTTETNWVKFHHLKQEILLEIGEIIASHKASIAYPTIAIKSDKKS
jgi:MscS family membrane protein